MSMATIPSPPTFTAGQVITASTFNTNVRDATHFLTGKPLCALSNSVVQSIANNTATAATFDTEATDSDNMHSTVTNTSRLPAVTPGWYMVSGNVPFASNATGSRWIAFQVNGLPASRIGFTQTGSAGGSGPETALSSAAPVFLNVNDYVEMIVLQTSGGALNIDTANGGVRLTALWIHT
jgi:hypothetical protein